MLERRRPARAGRSDLPLALALGTALLVLAVVPRVATVDGPAHVAGGWALAHLSDPLVGGLYEADLRPVPNLLVTLLLAALVPALGADLGERVLVALVVVLLPLAVRAALRGLHPQAGWAAVLAVPFATGYLLMFGFYNYVLGVGLALLCVALVLHRRSGWTPGSTAGLGALLLLTWSAHLLAALVAGVACGLLALARARAAGALRPLLPVAAAGLPVLLVTLLFLVDDAAARGAPERAGAFELLFGLLGLHSPLVVYTLWEQVPAAVLAVVLVALAVRARRVRLPPGAALDRRVLAAVTALGALAYAALPERFGEEYGFLSDRLALVVPLLLVLASAAPPPSGPWRRGVPALVLACAAALALLRLPLELHYQRGVAEVLSLAPAVPEGSLLVALRLERDPPPVRNPFRDPLRHVVSRLAVETGSVDAGHYEAALPYFPVRFREASSPRRAVDPTGEGLLRVPPVLDLAGAPVDGVVVLGDGPVPARLRVPLERDYRLAATSARGEAQLWLRRA